MAEGAKETQLSPWWVRLPQGGRRALLSFPSSRGIVCGSAQALTSLGRSLKHSANPILQRQEEEAGAPHDKGWIGQQTPYLKHRCPWWPLRPAAPGPGSEDALAARGRPGGPRVAKSGARPGTAHLRSTRKGSARAPRPRAVRIPAPPLAATNKDPRCPGPPRPPPALPLPPQGADPALARRGAPGGKLGAAGETRSDAAAVAAVPLLDRRPHQVPHPLRTRRSSPDPRWDLPPPFAPPAAMSASSKISPEASCPPRPSPRDRRGTQVTQERAGGGRGQDAHSRRSRAEGSARLRTGGQR